MEALFNGILVDPVLDRFVDLSFEVSEKIIRLLKEKNLTQRDLAARLNKKESEISKWLRGDHNFTLKTIAAVEIALDNKFVQIDGLDQDYFIIDNPDGQIKYIRVEDLIPSKAVSAREKDEHTFSEKMNKTKNSGYVLSDVASINI